MRYYVLNTNTMTTEEELTWHLLQQPSHHLPMKKSLEWAEKLQELEYRIAIENEARKVAKEIHAKIFGELKYSLNIKHLETIRLEEPPFKKKPIIGESTCNSSTS